MALNKKTKSIVILVTGGTGFLGSVLIEQLLDQGKRVRATKRAQSRIPVSLVDRTHLEWVDADVLDYFALAEAFDGVSQVFHCAAKVSYQPAHKEAMLAANVEGTAHVVNLCLDHQARLVHVSSIAALGESKDGQAISEGDLWEFSSSQSGYSISKYESEMEVWRGIAEGLDAIIVNPSLIIGARAGHRGSGQVFHLLYKGLKFFPTGSVGLVDVEDVAQVMIALMEQSKLSGQRYIVNNVNMTHQQLLTLSSNYLNRKPPSMKATPLLLELAWRASTLVARLSGKKSALTKESARVSSKTLQFSNAKLLSAVNHQFKPIDQTIKEICAGVLAHYQANTR
jgi:dihydroflavonol-4-reductase